jgi:hypothetical protein
MRSRNKFYSEFSDKLGPSQRWSAFSLIYEHLANLGRPVSIIETGTSRKSDDWVGDGNSTAVWDFIVKETSGQLTSIDIDREAVASAQDRFPEANVVESDSITALRNLSSIGDADLVYLDSMDYSAGNEQASALHHAAELCSVYDNLKSGCLIAIDDCFSPTQGKHAIASAVLSIVGAQRVLESYISVWRKP